MTIVLLRGETKYDLGPLTPEMRGLLTLDATCGRIQWLCEVDNGHWVAWPRWQCPGW